MPHIAEGLLHAHLDGALGPDEQLEWTAAERHLEVCEDCRERLEEAGELRDAARGLLAGAAAPAQPGPGIEALAAEAAKRRGGSTGGAGGVARRPGAGGRDAWWGSAARLAWAASLVMAAGAGWLGHELLMEQGSGPPPPAAVSEPSAREDLGDAAAGQGRETDTDVAARRERAQGAPAEEQEPPRRALEDAPVPMAEAEATPEAAGERLDEVRLQGQALKASGEGARCFEAAAELEAEDFVPDGHLVGPFRRLRLEPDGTVRVRSGGRSLVGFWESAAPDSLVVRITDGREWSELRFVETGPGLRGEATTGEPIGFRRSECP